MAKGKEEQRQLTQTRCDLCWSKNQAKRHIHFLRFPDKHSLSGHLFEQYGEKAQESGLISTVLAWVRQIEDLYRERVNEEGVRIPTWQAWVEANGCWIFID